MMIETDCKNKQEFYKAFSARVKKVGSLSKFTGQVLDLDSNSFYGAVDYSFFWLFKPRVIRVFSQRFFKGKCYMQDGKVFVDGAFHFPKATLFWDVGISLFLTLLIALLDLVANTGVYMLPLLFGGTTFGLLTGIPILTSRHLEADVIRMLSSLPSLSDNRANDL